MLELEDEIEIHNEQNPDNQKNYNSATGIVLTINRNTKMAARESAYKSALHSKDQFENELQRLQLHIVRVEELKVIKR
jgi:hypothetical protein